MATSNEALIRKHLQPYFAEKNVPAFLIAPIEAIIEDIQSDIGCKCTREENHGETSVLCCNECGKPVEAFWIKQSTQK